MDEARAVAWSQYSIGGPSMTGRTANHLIFLLCFIGGLAVSTLEAAAQTVPTGYTIPDITLSPDHRYGVTVPGLDTPNPHNSLIEIKTGRVLAEIQADTGYERANHISLLPSRWTKDNSFLLWEVDGKWFDTALVLLKLENGEVVWQRNLLEIGQQAILARTKRAAPRKYRAAKEQNKGNGSAYPDGFTVVVTVGGKEGESLSLPLAIFVSLTSNPKGQEDPKFINLDAELEASMNSEGKFTVTKFHLGTKSPASRW
jgi:hypothetical protein